jgi:hypothetical protein
VIVGGTVGALVGVGVGGTVAVGEGVGVGVDSSTVKLPVAACITL